MFYVAMTRAKEKLILSAAVKAGEKETEALAGSYDEKPLSSAELKSANCFLDWILAARARDSAGCGIVLRRESAVSRAETVLGEATEVAALKEALSSACETKASEEERKRFLPLFLPYAHAADVNLQVKRSASELKRLHETAEEGISAPLFLLPLNGGAETAARRGTAYHKVFETIDFGKDRNEAELKLFLDELERRGALEKEDRELLSAEPILNFLSSELAARMARADRENKLHRESSFVMSVPAREADPSVQSEEAVVVQGVIDAWFEENGELILLDYKTDRNRDPEHYRENYTAQLSLYARALEMTEGKRVAQKLIYALGPGELLTL